MSSLADKLAQEEADLKAELEAVTKDKVRASKKEAEKPVKGKSKD